jgi:hypothetical protein
MDRDQRATLVNRMRLRELNSRLGRPIDAPLSDDQLAAIEFVEAYRLGVIEGVKAVEKDLGL